MSLLNPATWTVVDNLQGQNDPISAWSGGTSGDGSSGGGGTTYSDTTLPNTVYYDAGSGTVQGPGVGNLPTAQTGPTAEQIAETNRQNAARANFTNGVNVFNSSINDTIGQAGRNYQRGIQDTVNGWNTQQQGLDNKGINNMMAKTQGQNGIMQMVGQGIRSAGTMLGNRNAGSSSASQAIADAYGKLGQQQASQVGNQYEIANNQLMTEQDALTGARNLQQGRWGEDKTTVVNSIVTEAQRQIAALNEAAAGASISDRMDMAAEAERIKNQATAELQKYDSELTKIAQAQTDEQRRSKASQLATAGTANPVQFQYSTQMPGAFQDTGNFSSSMPLFTYGSNKNKQTA